VNGASRAKEGQVAVIYGVLRGTLDRWKREDPAPGSNKSPHLQVRVIDGQGRRIRILGFEDVRICSDPQIQGF
jgi:hypothetical protein